MDLFSREALLTCASVRLPLGALFLPPARARIPRLPRRRPCAAAAAAAAALHRRRRHRHRVSPHQLRRQPLDRLFDSHRRTTPLSSKPRVKALAVSRVYHPSPSSRRVGRIEAGVMEKRWSTHDAFDVTTAPNRASTRSTRTLHSVAYDSAVRNCATPFLSHSAQTSPTAAITLGEETSTVPERCRGSQSTPPACWAPCRV